MNNECEALFKNAPITKKTRFPRINLQEGRHVSVRLYLVPRKRIECIRD